MRRGCGCSRRGCSRRWRPWDAGSSRSSPSRSTTARTPSARPPAESRVSNSRLVWSTDGGDERKRAQRPPDAAHGPQLPADGVVRLFREKGGRGGKTVTVVRGLPAHDVETVAKDLKRLCG